MIVKLNHASFTVSNLKKSVNFYKKILGFKLVNFSVRNKRFSELVTGVHNAKLKIAYLKKANFYLELIEYINGKGTKVDTSVNNTGSSHICFDIKNFDFFLNNLIKNNVKFVGTPTTIPAGPNKGKRVLYFEDIDNNTLEIISLNRYHKN